MELINLQALHTPKCTPSIWDANPLVAPDGGWAFWTTTVSSDVKVCTWMVEWQTCFKALYWAEVKSADCLKKQPTTLLTTISKNPLYEPWSSFLFFFFFYGLFCVMQTNLSSVKAPKHQDRGIILSICNQCLILTFTNIQTGIVTCAYSPVSHNCSTNKLGDKLKSHIKFYSAFHQCSLTIKFPNPEENARLCPADMCSRL